MGYTNLHHDNYPMVSVVVPVHNAGAALEQCVTSIRNQTLKDIQIVFIDDASTDDSVRRLDEARLSDTRIQVIRLPVSRGAGAARNVGLAEVKAKYVIFLDADDVFDCNMLLFMSQALEESGADVCICEANEFVGEKLTENNSRPRFRFADSLKQGLHKTTTLSGSLFQLCIPAPWNKLFKTSLIRGRDILFQEIHHANDVYFTSAALASSSSIYVMKEPLVYYRIGQNGSLQDNKTIEPMCPYKAACKLYSFIEQSKQQSSGMLTSAARLCFELTSRAVAASAISESLSEHDMQIIRQSFQEWKIEDRGVLNKPRSKYLYNRFMRLSSEAIVWAYKGRSNLRGETKLSGVRLALRMLLASAVSR